MEPRARRLEPLRQLLLHQQVRPERLRRIGRPVPAPGVACHDPPQLLIDTQTTERGREPAMKQHHRIVSAVAAGLVLLAPAVAMAGMPPKPASEKLVVAFLDLAFNQKQPKEAFA